LKHLIAIVTLLVVGTAALGQNRPSPLVSKASLDFDKVDSAPIPTVSDTMRCVQSNAAAVPVVRPEERYLFNYRKGYCELFGAVLIGNSEGFQAAAADFNETVTNWPKKMVVGPPAGLRALSAIARIEQGRMVDSYPDIVKDLTSIAADPNCSATPVMSTSFCSALLETVRTWLGWLAYRKSDFAQATQLLKASAGSPWNLFVSGRVAQDQKRLPEAANLYLKALSVWAGAQKSPNPDVVTLLGPKLDTSAIYYQLGLVDYANQNYESAIARFDAVLKESPRNSYAIFLRARSKESLRLYAPALDDYSLAIQTARATNDSSWNVGQAHYSRGLLLYRAKDFARAEAEFANTSGARLTEVTQSDVAAWRAMAFVAGGGCKVPLDGLEAAAKAASNQFPKAEADALVYDCRLKQASTLDQYLALEKTYSGRLPAANLRDLRNRIANAYADRGVVAEDRKDPYTAVIEYRRALEWDPVNAKARFNLGAIYIEDKRYNLAETEYRAMVEADGNDHEAQYWLGQSILAQRPPADRVQAACDLLRHSLAISDPQKKAQFAKALTAAKCPN